MPKTSKKSYAKQSRRVIGFLFDLRKVAPILTAGMALSMIIGVVATSTVSPLFVSKLLSQIATGTASLQASGGLLAGYLIALVIGEVITMRIAIALAYHAETRMQQRTAERVLDSQIEKSLDFHANRMSGGIVSDATKLNSSIERFWDTLIFTAIPIATTVIAVCIALAFFVWQYAIVLFLLSSLISLFIVRAQGAIAPISRIVSEKGSAGTAYFADVISNMSAVKAFAGGDLERAAYSSKWDELRRANMREMRSVLLITGTFSTLMTILNGAAFLGAIIVTQHHLASIGPIYLMISYTLNIVSQLWQISSATRNYVRTIGDAAPMIAMLEEEPYVRDPTQPETAKISTGDIIFSKVTFQHDGASRPLFVNFDLKVMHGEKIGLVGHSGSGKTTFTRLLLRFSDIEKGQILIDGQDITHITQDDLRRHIAYVPQEPLLFHRTIAENISYGKPGSSLLEIEQAARAANAHEFIKTLPKGYETLVGERGVKLSGGQRQRIAIARAMLKDAPILVLDEATSALDSESEKLIQDALWKLMEGRTAIVIAHRLSTIQKMDRIVVLDEGEIVEHGSHKELLAKKGTYAKLWAHQSGGFLED